MDDIAVFVLEESGGPGSAPRRHRRRRRFGVVALVAGAGGVAVLPQVLHVEEDLRVARLKDDLVDLLGGVGGRDQLADDPVTVVRLGARGHAGLFVNTFVRTVHIVS